MDLLEYEAKAILRKFTIPVPSGFIIDKPTSPVPFILIMLGLRFILGTILTSLDVKTKDQQPQAGYVPVLFDMG